MRTHTNWKPHCDNHYFVRLLLSSYDVVIEVLKEDSDGGEEVSGGIVVEGNTLGCNEN